MSKYRLEHPLDDTVPLIMPGVNPDASCIYIFFIDGQGCYVGKSDAKNPKNRWRKIYSKNVRDMMAGKPWHNDPTKDFRPIHYALHQAVKKNLTINLIIFENGTGRALVEREQELIKCIGTLNGRRPNTLKKAGQKEEPKAAGTRNKPKLKKTKTGKQVSSNQSKSSQASNWLDYQIEATKNVANGFTPGDIRWKRIELLARHSSSIVIREFQALCRSQNLRAGNKTFFQAAIKKGYVHILDANGRALTGERFSKFLEKLKPN